jgi:hypothetical protein
MKNLAGIPEVNDYIQEELYLAGVTIEECDENKGEVEYSFIGKIGKWTLKRAWYYWVASVEKIDDGLILDKAMELHNKPYPIKGVVPNLGQIIRSGGHCGAPPPDEYGARIDWDVFEDSISKDITLLDKIKKGEDFRKKYKGSKYVTCYHIDSQIGLNEFVKFIKENE